MNRGLLNVLLLPETDIFMRFPELEQKVDYFLFDWDDEILMKTYTRVITKIQQKMHINDPYFHNDFSNKKKFKSKKKAIRAKRLLNEELDTLVRSKNVLWRSYISNKHPNSHKYPPEKINWNKDVDCIFLYGPIYKSEISLPWSSRSPNPSDGHNLKSALKKTPPLSLYGILTPPSANNNDSPTSKTSSPTSEVSPSSTTSISSFRNAPFLNHDSLKTPPSYNYDPSKISTELDFNIIPNDSSTINPELNYKKPKLRFNKEVEQCMVVFRQEEELLPTDFEDTADEDDSSFSSKSSLCLSSDPIKLGINITDDHTFPNSTFDNYKKIKSSPRKSLHLKIQSNIDDYFSDSSKESTHTLKNNDIPISNTAKKSNNSVCPTNTPQSPKNGSSSQKNSTTKSRKRRNRSTFVIKLAPTSLKNCSGSNATQDSADSISGFSIRKNLLSRNRNSTKNRNLFLDDDFGLEIKNKLESPKSDSWLWNTLGLSSSPSSSHINRPSNIDTSDLKNSERTGLSSAILSSSPTQIISNLSESVTNVISSNWDNLFASKYNKNSNSISSSSDSAHIESEPLNSSLPTLEFSNLSANELDNLTNPKETSFDFLSSNRASSSDTPFILDTNPESNLNLNIDSDFDFIIPQKSYASFNSNQSVDVLDSSNYTYSKSEFSPNTATSSFNGSAKPPASMLWPAIKESGENLFDNAEDRIATTVDAVKWLSSFFSNYSPF
ncbi:hypothetical protein AYI70_g6771 [Smittium culicis]|uniref:Uncharacterized protein n=1 Tax=Smittium culicis TaxID=133412 RepID=A0A1R1XNI8_9FUNG|nr:hypothetical protein AYI70_g7254 [Smittium culicis]OMJ16178.1 hypothetical protein AYI70_g6771 [Smittium culicis]